MSREGSVRLFVLVVTAAVAAAVIAGLVAVGSPGKARLEKLDRRRVSDLYAIVDSVNVYWTRHASLPPNLGTLADELAFELQSDPETKDPYTYRVLETGRYEICATFATECQATNDACSHWRARQDPEIRGHRAGLQCFEVTPREIEGHR